MMLNEYIKREDVLLLAREYYTPALRESAVPVKAIKNIPAEDVVPVRRGKWECDSDGILKCSCCEETALQRILLRFPKPEYVSHFVLSNFCPNCGADMMGEDNG